MSLLRYRLTQAAYIDNQLRRAGDIVATDLAPGRHMVLVPDIDAPPTAEAAPADSGDWPFARSIIAWLAPSNAPSGAA